MSKLHTIIAGLLALSSMAANAQNDCDGTTPIGAQAPAIPVWCLTAGADGSGTFIQFSNGWLDEFDHGLSNAALGDGYQSFLLGNTERQQHFRHANHWMQDASLTHRGGATMRPDASFRFENGRFSVETDVAAGVSAYGTSIWSEITVTTAPQPSGARRDAIYAYDYFPGYYTLGCRLQAERVVTCALFNDLPGETGNESRIWEMSFFQHIGTENFGGGPFGDADAAWRLCEGSDPDINCRDRFRLELSETSLALNVNGMRYFSQNGIPPLPPEFMNQALYVYFSGVVTSPQTGVARFHWDRVAVNMDTTVEPPIGPLPIDPICRLQQQQSNGEWVTVSSPVQCPP